MIRQKSIVVGRNMIQEFDYEKHYIYKFSDMWFEAKQLVSLLNRMGMWTEVKTNTTKYRILQDELRWLEVPFDFFGDVAAPLFDDYRITTNGRILDKKNHEMAINNLSVRLTVDGLQRQYYVADLMWHAFVDNNYDPELRLIYFANTNAEFKRKTANNDIGLDELMIKSKQQDKYDAAVADKADPSPQTLTTTPGETLFGTTLEIDTPEPLHDEQHEQLQDIQQTTELNGSAPRVMTVKRRERRVY